MHFRYFELSPPHWSIKLSKQLAILCKSHMHCREDAMSNSSLRILLVFITRVASVNTLSFATDYWLTTSITYFWVNRQNSVNPYVHCKLWLTEIILAETPCPTFCPIDVTRRESCPDTAYLALPQDKAVQIYSMCSKLTGECELYSTCSRFTALRLLFLAPGYFSVIRVTRTPEVSAYLYFAQGNKSRKMIILTVATEYVSCQKSGPQRYPVKALICTNCSLERPLILTVICIIRQKTHEEYI